MAAAWSAGVRDVAARRSQPRGTRETAPGEYGRRALRLLPGSVPGPASGLACGPHSVSIPQGAAPTGEKVQPITLSPSQRPARGGHGRVPYGDTQRGLGPPLCDWASGLGSLVTPSSLCGLSREMLTVGVTPGVRDTRASAWTGLLALLDSGWSFLPGVGTSVQPAACPLCVSGRP